jgi:hypothetical protein
MGHGKLSIDRRRTEKSAGKNEVTTGLKQLAG